MNVSIQDTGSSTVYSTTFSIRTSSSRTVDNMQLPQLGLGDLLEEISSLQENWDGYGACAVDPMVIRHTFEALCKFIAAKLPPDDVTPRSPGTIALVWAHNDSEAEVEIGKTRYVGFVKMESSTNYLQGRSVDIDAAVVDAVRRLYKAPMAVEIRGLPTRRPTATFAYT